MRPIISASVVLSLALLAGRLTGLVREWKLASLFGVSPTADMAILLLTLPDLLVNLLISGGLSAALVPRFASLPAGQSIALFRYTSITVFVLFGLAGLILVVWPQAIFYVLAPGLETALTVHTAGMIALAVALPLSGLAGVTAAYLNASQRFLVAGCGTLLFNAGVLIALMFTDGAVEPLTVLAFGIVAGAALRWGGQLIALPRLVWHVKATHEPDSTLARSFAGATLAAGLVLLAPILVRAMASTLGSGAIASFNYAQKLIELPIAILITSISTVALSRLSTLHAQNRTAEATASAVRDTQYALMVAIVVSIFGMWFGGAAVDVVFSGGKMDHLALKRITELTCIALLGVPLVALGSMATAHLSAVRRIDLVLRVTVGSLVLLAVLALPSVLLGSERGLMFAVVGFQAVSALWLAREAKLPLRGPAGVLGSATWPYFGAAACVAVLFVGLDAAIDVQNQWIRLLLASAGFAVAILVPVRRFLKFPAKQPQLT